MNIIFLTDSYFPNPSANAICVAKVVDRLVSLGEKPIIITLKNQPNLPDQTDYGRYNVIYLTPNLLNYLHYTNKLSPNKWRSLFLSMMWRVKGAVYGLFWPLLSISSVWKYYKAGRNRIQNIKNNQPIVVITVYKSLEACLAGILLKHKFPSIKFIIYSLDAMSGSIIPTILHSPKIAQKSIERWEKLAFKSADLIYLMQAHHNYYNTNKYNSFRHKIKYMDIPLIYELEVKKTIKITPSSPHFVYTGLMSKETADPGYFIQLLSLSNWAQSVTFDIYGHITDEISQKLSKHNSGSLHICTHGKVSHESILSIQQNAEFLINFGNSNSCAIPCKIFEYISAQRPIISFYKSDQDASAHYLKKYPWALLLDERIPLEQNSRILKEFITRIMNSTIEPIDITSMFINNTPEPIVHEILNIHN